MSILIVDDSQSSRMLLSALLKKAGYENIIMAQSAESAFEKLGLKETDGVGNGVDLILMDVIMPKMDGIEATAVIKKDESLRDIPIVMVTAMDEVESLQLAFSAGAIDYIAKPFHKVELLARVSSALKLKHETDQRKAREKELLEVTRQLEEANAVFKRLSSIDGLTGVANRRQFDSVLEKEWHRAKRSKGPVSMVMIDIDYFKLYNDTYGHQGGDDCLKNVAKALGEHAQRPGDLVARYGGEEFAIILPGTPGDSAEKIGNQARAKVESMKVPHANSEVADHVTISVGVATVVPIDGIEPGNLIQAADSALYKAKKEGRNRVVRSV